VPIYLAYWKRLDITKRRKEKKKNVEILFSNKEKEETVSDGIDQTVGLELISIDSKMILFLIKEKRMTQLFYTFLGFSFLSWAKNEKYKKKLQKGKEIHNSRAP
jgi:hypothetical protein